MVVFLDTSSLVKLYIEEAGSAEVHRLVGAAEAVAVSRIAYAEARATFARRAGEGVVSTATLSQIRKALDEDWPSFVRLECDELQAGQLAEKHLLRGMDALHLAAAVEVNRGTPDRQLIFSCFDHRLRSAALAEGLRVP